MHHVGELAETAFLKAKNLNQRPAATTGPTLHAASSKQIAAKREPNHD